MIYVYKGRPIKQVCRTMAIRYGKNKDLSSVTWIENQKCDIELAEKGEDNTGFKKVVSVDEIGGLVELEGLEMEKEPNP